MINISSMAHSQNNKPVSFEKSPKEIKKEAPNKELRLIADWLTDSFSEHVIDYGVPMLLKYSEKGDIQKEQAISLIKDVVESEQVRKKADKYTFNGEPILRLDNTLGTKPGLKGAYETLTGEQLDINI